MDISIKSISLLGAVILTGLSAGLFYAWSVSVIPGTKKVIDSTYLQTMQAINQAILNPAFFFIFFGSLILLGISSLYEFQGNRLVFSFLIAAFCSYLFGTFAVTGLGNVPLNNQLEALELQKLSADQLKTFRNFYESKWNRLHLIRTVFAVLSFALSVIALFLQNKNVISKF